MTEKHTIERYRGTTMASPETINRYGETRLARKRRCVWYNHHMPWARWKEERDDTVFLFEPVSGRPTDRAIIVYHPPGPADKAGLYDRLDAVTRKSC
jgi:hypothetical protein